MTGVQMTWTQITDPDEATNLFPPWLARRLVGLRGSFGLLLTTGDVLRITTVVAVHLSSQGTILLDVLLDHAGVPDGVDLAWRPKHYLGAPVVGATLATVNLEHVIAAVEFVDIELAEPPAEVAIPTTDKVVADLGRLAVQPAVAAQTTAGLLEEG